MQSLFGDRGTNTEYIPFLSRDDDLTLMFVGAVPSPVPAILVGSLATK